MASDGDTSHYSSSSGSRSASDDLSAVETLTREGSQLMTKKRLRRSIKKYTKAYKLAEQLSDDVALQSCACNLGAALIAQGEAKQAIRYLQNALPDHGNLPGKDNKHGDSILADLHYNLGLGYSMLGNSKDAKKSFTKSIELFIACDDVKAFAEGYRQLGEQYLHNHQLLTAATCFEESSKAFGTVNDLFSEVKMRLKQGECLVIQGKETEGQKVAKECDVICEALLISSNKISADTGKKARCFHDLGILHSKLNSHQSASRWYEAALVNMRSSNAIGVENQEARILENLGLTCNIIQQYSRAIQLHKEAASLHGALGNSSERGWCFYHLAEAYRNLGHHSDAERTYHVAFQIFEDAGQTQWQWKVLVGLGDLSYDRRSLDMAVDFYKEALKQLSKDRGDDGKPFETHVMEKLVLALQVQRAGIVRIASYKKRKPVLINPELEKIVLESMSSALQHSMNFEDEELPKLPTLDPNDDMKNYEPLSPTFKPPGHNHRPLTYGRAAMPSPIIESPSPMPSVKPPADLEQQDRNYLQSPKRHHRKSSRKHKKLGRRVNSFGEAPVPKGVGCYSSHTDLSLIDSGSARDLRLVAAYADQLRKSQKKREGKNKLFSKLAKTDSESGRSEADRRHTMDGDRERPERARSGGRRHRRERDGERLEKPRGGQRRKSDVDGEKPENILQGLEYSKSQRQRSRQRPKSSRKKNHSQVKTATADETGATMASTGFTMASTGSTLASTGSTMASTGSTMASTGSTMASTSTGSYTSHGSTMTSSASSLTEVSDDNDDGIFTSSDDDDDTTVGGDSSSDSDIGSESSDGEDVSSTESSDGSVSDSETEASVSFGTTYERPIFNDPPYATIRSNVSPRGSSQQEPLYETLNGGLGSYSLASTAPLREPDSPPAPEPPSSQRPSRHHSQASHSASDDEEADSWSHSGRETYLPSPIMQHTRAHRESGLYEMAKLEQQRRNYIEHLKNPKMVNGENKKSEVKRDKVTSAMCAVM